MELCGSLMFTAHLCIGKYGLVIYYNMLFFFTDTPNRKVGKTDLMQNIEKTKGNEKKRKRGGVLTAGLSQNGSGQHECAYADGKHHRTLTEAGGYG